MYVDFLTILIMSVGLLVKGKIETLPAKRYKKSKSFLGVKHLTSPSNKALAVGPWEWGTLGMVGQYHLYDPIFVQCFDTVGWVISPVKARPRYDL